MLLHCSRSCNKKKETKLASQPELHVNAFKSPQLKPIPMYFVCFTHALTGLTWNLFSSTLEELLLVFTCTSKNSKNHHQEAFDFDIFSNNFTLMI